MGRTIIIRVFILLAGLILAMAASAQHTAEKYAEAIEKADQYFEQGDFLNAKAAYQMASGIQPEKDYPKEKLKESMKRLRGQLEKKNQYSDKIKQADELFENASWEKAIAAYREAAAILPGEKYPAQQIALAQDRKANEEADREKYDDLIRQANTLRHQEEYDRAESIYADALSLFPDAQYPREQMKQIDSIRASKRLMNASYQQAMDNAEQYIQRKNYKDALKSFEKAAELKPGEELPREKITELKKFLVTYERYSKLISQADDLYIGKQYEEAREKYRAALDVLPGEPYPRDLINKINEVLEEKAVEDWQKYDELVAEADQLFDQEEYEKAVQTYQDALRFKPDGDYAQNKISDITGILNLKRSQEDAYDNTIRKANQLFNEEKYTEALEAYEKAHDIKPMEQYPKVRIDEIDVILTQIKNKQDIYDRTINGADKLFNAGDYREALIQYQSALETFPGKNYPTDQIRMINDILDKESSVEEAYRQIIAGADRLFEDKDYEQSKREYLKALEIRAGEKYPKDRVSEINGILSDIQVAIEHLTLALQEAKQLYEDGKYGPARTKITDARSEYRETLELKPGKPEIQQKTSEMDRLLEEITRKQAMDQRFEALVRDADSLFEQGSLERARGKYTEARDLRPDASHPKNQIAGIDGILEEMAVKEERNAKYAAALEQADRFLETGNYEEAMDKYDEAASLKPGETYPAEKLEEVRQEMARQKALDEAYDQALATAEELMDKGMYEDALAKYEEAANQKPEQKLPQQKISEVRNIMDEIAREKAIDEKYAEAVQLGEASMKAEKYAEALSRFEQAKEIKPGEAHPENKIIEINEILREIEEEKEKAYNIALSRGDNFLEQKDYREAITAYKTALSIKPAEVYPKEKMDAAEELYKAELETLKKSYRKIIAEADGYFRDNIYDQALDKYAEAHALLPDEDYPLDMTSKIKKIINDNAIVDINQETIRIPANTEKRFLFDPMPVTVRKDNYLLVKAQNPLDREFKMLVNFGQDGSKYGGVAIKIPGSAEEQDYIIRIGALYKWFSEDNNWVSIYPEGSDVEVSLIRISKSN
ncbi:MAG: hypothetical protein R6T99_11065 [Bacteroidales bacterium]